MEQTALETGEQEGRSDSCAWCGEKAFAELEIRPAKFTTYHNGGESQKVMAKRPLVVPVCPKHEKTLVLTEQAMKRLGRE